METAFASRAAAPARVARRQRAAGRSATDDDRAEREHATPWARVASRHVSAAHAPIASHASEAAAQRGGRGQAREQSAPSRP